MKCRSDLRRFQVIPCLFLLFAAAACRGPGHGNTSTLNLVLSTPDSSRSLLPDSSLVIDYYTISGDGPGENTFNISTRDSVAAVPGLETGIWDITAFGWNDQGVRLITGSTTVNLVPGMDEAVISLEQYFGTGTLSITAIWDDSLTYNPDFKLFIAPQGGTEIEVMPTVAAGSASYAAEMDAGSYILRCELHSGGEIVSGCVEAIRIVDAHQTTGSIVLDLNTHEINLNIHLDSSVRSPVTGTISGIPDQPIEAVPFTVSFIPTNVGSDELADLSVSWYLNGIFQQSGMSCPIDPGKGNHRIDAVAATSAAGSSGSESSVFTAVAAGSSGTLSLAGILSDNENGLQLDGIADVISLADGLLVTVSSTDDSISTYRMESGLPALKQVIENNPEIPLDGAVGIAATNDGSLVFVLSYYSKSLSIFSHAPGTDTLEFIEAFSGTFTFDSIPVEIGFIRGMVVDSESGNIYIIDKLEKRLYHFYYSGTEVIPIDYYTFQTDPVIETFRSVSMSPNGLRLAITSAVSNTLLILAIDPVTGVPSIDTLLSYSGTGTMGLGTINSALFIDNNTILTTSADFLCVFAYGAETPDSLDTWYQVQRLKEGAEVPVMDGPKYIAFNENSNIVYTATSISKGITSFRRNPDTGILTYENFLGIDPGTPFMIHLTKDRKNLLAVSPSTDEMYVLQIAP